MFDKNFTWVAVLSNLLLPGGVASHFKRCLLITMRLVWNTSKVCRKYISSVLFGKIPDAYNKHAFELPLKIYYAGRGGPQKSLADCADYGGHASKEPAGYFKLAAL